ncbi:MAG: LCP family protein [Oscillospiraceae bacterium]|nr:LCP family protein [Oscillospiraceae bacterium]
MRKSSAQTLLFNGKRLRTIILSVLLAVALAASAVFAYVYTKVQKTTTDQGYHYADFTAPEDEVTGLEVGYENVDAASLDEYLRQWATNSIQPLADKNVVNILLCGIDSEDGNALGGRSDAMMLVSINKKRKRITVCSFYRDSYSYIDLRKRPKNPCVIYDRVNSAYSLGGPATLIETLQANYKITINHYVSVDFKSFPKLIDALGGVRVDVTKTEASYVNRTAPSMNWSFPSGSGVTLNGKQALVYSRIRKLDSDIKRAERQRKIMLSILDSARKATPGQINNAMDQTLGYVVTSMTRMEITSMLTTAFSQGWLDYEVVQCNSPVVETEDATGFSTYIRGRWLWIVDYPRAAHDLQLQLYGISNIGLQANRDDYLAGLFREAKQSGSPSPSGQTTTRVQTTEPPPDFPTEESTLPPEEDTTSRWPWLTRTQPTEPETEPTEEPPTLPPESEPETEPETEPPTEPAAAEGFE